MTIARTAALIAFCACQASALELLSNDLRLGYTWCDTKEDSTTGGVKTSDDWDQSRRVFLDWVGNIKTPIIGVLYGAGGSYDDRKKDVAGGSAKYSAFGVHVHAGAYLSLGIVRLELMPFIGIGNAKLETSAGSDSGHVTEYGANLNLVAFIPVIPLCAGVGIGYLHSQSSHSIGGTTTDLSSGNGTASIFVGYTF